VTIKDHLQAVTALARDLREQTARRGRVTISAHVLAYRGLEPVAAVVVAQHQRDRVLEAADIAARGFGADAIALVMDTWCATDDFALYSPLTGQSWGPGEMQHAAEDHGAVEKGWLSDALLVTVHNRAGDVAAVTLPYRIASREVIWAEPQVEPAGLLRG
jgi:hypothetical protein